MIRKPSTVVQLILVFTIVQNVFGFCFGAAVLPLVNLTNYQMKTDDQVTWQSSDRFLLPTFFEELQFMCNSSYPTEWVFSFNPLEDDSLKEVPRISKFRIVEIHDGNPMYIFSSIIHFKFKYATSIQKFACQSVRKYNLNQVVAISTQQNSPNILSVRISTEPNYLQTENRYGSNTDCRMAIDVDLNKKKYDCKINGNYGAGSRLLSCRNKDECNAITVPNPEKCRNAINLKCDIPRCVQFTPKPEPGVIMCKEGHISLALKFTVTHNRNTRSTNMALYHDNDPPKNFISISQYNQTVYEGETIPFVCKGSMYVFSKGFQWGFWVQNGSYVEFLNTGDEDVKFVDHTYVVTKNVTFNSSNHNDIHGVVCYGPVWNSYDQTKAIALVHIKRPVAPIIFTPSRNYTVSTGNLTLRCDFFAQPAPIVDWMFWNRTIKEGLNTRFKFKIIHQPNFTEFQIPNMERQGKHERSQFTSRITCRVKNFLGEERRTFLIKPQEIKKQGLENKILIGVIVTMVVVIIAVVVVGLIYIRYIRRKNELYLQRDIKLFLEGNSNITAKEEHTHLVAYKKPYDTNLEIPFQDVEIDKTTPLGSGAFGLVLKGSVTGGRCTSKTEVAIKTLKPNVEPNCFRSLLTELKVMIYVGNHINIVNLLGACTKNISNLELYIVLELCKNGELEKYLRLHRKEFVNQVRNGRLVRDLPRMSKKNSGVANLSTVDLIMWSYQIAHGMEYLASKKVIHGDLATRNVLLQEDLTAKICDFGLSHQLYQYTQYIKKHQAPLPWRWMAIESLRDLQFSSESDVWGYGITLWEIFTLAEVPYPGMSWNHEFMKSLVDGYRLTKPTFCPNDIDILMKDCWKLQSKERPTFSQIRNHLRLILNASLNMTKIPEET